MVMRILSKGSITIGMKSPCVFRCVLGSFLTLPIVRPVRESPIMCILYAKVRWKLEDIVNGNLKESFAPLIQLFWLSLLCDELTF